MAEVATSSRKAKMSPMGRSRVSNGKGLFVAEDIDHRSKEARRFRDVLSEIVSDLGGAEGLSEGQRQLARRAALMSVQCEILEGKAVAGDEIDLETFGKLADRIGRTFHRLGLKRVAKPLAADSLAAHFDQPYSRVAAE